MCSYYLNTKLSTFGNARKVVLCGLCNRYNRLLTVIHRSLYDLLKALKGLVVMSLQLELMANSLYINQVPTMWADKVQQKYNSISLT